MKKWIKFPPWQVLSHFGAFRSLFFQKCSRIPKWLIFQKISEMGQNDWKLSRVKSDLLFHIVLKKMLILIRLIFSDLTIFFINLVVINLKRRFISKLPFCVMLVAQGLILTIPKAQICSDRKSGVKRFFVAG